ncbi:MAG: hypothetical protein AAFQ36_01525 [Pseudomonadota bacterium]
MAKVQRYYRNKNMWDAAQSFMDLIYISVVREFRTTSGGAMMSFAMAFGRPIVLFLIFFAVYEFFGRSMLIRGDFVMFMMTGIFAYLMHIRAVKNLQGAGGGAAGMIFYARASKLLNLLASAFHELYLNIIAMMVVMATAYFVRGYLEAYQPHYMIKPMFFAWASGLGVGMTFAAIAPMAPMFASSFFMIYRRVQMITSGKAFVANVLPTSLLPFFTWNPLFHCIDQARGFAFINYVPRVTNMSYPIYCTLALISFALITQYAYRAAEDRGLE